MTRRILKPLLYILPLLLMAGSLVAAPAKQIKPPDPPSEQATQAERSAKKDATPTVKSPAQTAIYQTQSPDDASVTDEDISDSLPIPNGDHPPIPADGYKSQFIRTVIAVVIVFILVIITILMLKRFSNSRPFHMNSRKNIKILERRPLSANTCIYHLRVGDKECIIAESKLDVRNVMNLDWSETETPLD